jgi:uncharacterized protein (DUF2236 family)
MLRAAVDILPRWVRDRLGLGPRWGLGRVERSLVRRAGAVANGLRLDGSPAAQASIRLGLAPDYLWSKP